MSKSTHRGILFWAAVVVVAYALMSVALAVATASDCPDGVSQSWKLIPPEWECGI
ncbi:MAG TPA: hypothetical protein VMW08_14970 [Acidimicrobiales bacterium]|nr:hypothetical protein [Acidimicrobiales bacterium]